MPSFTGSLRIAGSRDAPLDATISVENGRMTLVGGSQEIGAWSLSEVQVKRDGNAARLRIEDEVIVFKTEEVAELAEAVNPPVEETGRTGRSKRSKTPRAERKSREKTPRAKRSKRQRAERPATRRSRRSNPATQPGEVAGRLRDPEPAVPVRAPEPEPAVDPYQTIASQVAEKKAERSEAPPAPEPVAPAKKPKKPRPSFAERFEQLSSGLQERGWRETLSGRPAIVGGVVLVVLLVVFAPAVLGGLLLLAGGGLFLLATVAWMDPMVEARLPAYAPLKRLVFVALLTLVAAIAIGAIA